MSEKTMVESPNNRGIKDLASRLYRGEAGIDVVGKRKVYYAVAAAILLLGVITFSVQKFNLGLEFKGGNSFQIPASIGTLDQARAAVADSGATVVTAQRVGGGTPTYKINTALLDEDPAVAAKKATEIKQKVATQFAIDDAQISESAVSGAWGTSVAVKALQGALVFLVLVVVYLAAVLREWRMAVAAIAALLQNLILTATIYLIVGFEVTPSTVIGFLTILGFALYDVVVVFDKVRENTQGIAGNATRTYGEAANLAVNQTLMRSINTAVVALLPVGGLLFIGAGLLGAGTLKDLGLVLFVGMLAAVYSSIFFATPVLVDIKEREPKFKLHKQRVLARRAAAAAGDRKSGVSRPGESDKDTATPRQSDGESDDTAALAGAAPRAGARPAARKRPGAGTKPGGGRSGGGKRR